MNLSALAFAFSISAAVPVGFHHSYFLWPVLPMKLRTYSSHVQSGLVVPSGFIFFLLHKVLKCEPTFYGFDKMLEAIILFCRVPVKCWCDEKG